MPNAGAREADRLYEKAAAEYGAALERLARGYERDADKCRDLLQEIHVALWRSFHGFDSRCSLRTWVYRVAHNTATSQVLRPMTKAPSFVPLDGIDPITDPIVGEETLDRQRTLDRLYELIHRLDARDRQVMLLYLESVDAATIAEVTGLSASNVATKVHRIKQLLVRRFHERSTDVR